MATKRISLDGEWTFCWCEAGAGEAAGWPSRGLTGPEVLPAQVPGLTHLDLMAANKIPDPLYGENAKELTWMEEKDWWYSRSFRLSQDDLADRAEIDFEGLATLADIWVNGDHVGSSRNALVPWRADITPHVKAGDNLLVVRVDTGLRWSRGQDISRYGHRASAADGDQSRILLRRNAFSTRWDWSPNLPTCGIWQPVRLEIHRGLALRDVCLRSRLAPDGSAALTALVEVEGLGDKTAEVLLDFELEGAVRSPLRASLVPGYNLVTHTFHLQDPRLWWPHGMGEPHLYQFTCHLSDGDGAPVDSTSFLHGVREIELRQEPLPGDEGQSFTLLVNGVPVFCKGGDWVPADSLLSRVTPERYQALIREACGANFNMLRIWGGGTYEADAFWEACDRLGIMVWLDYQLACQQTPEDLPDYLAEIQREADLATRRLRNHPSLVLWSGNNENQWLYHRGGQRYYGWRTYHEVFARAAALLDPTRPYWPSSPYGGPGFNDWHLGDRHAWQVSLVGDAPGGISDYQAMALDRGKFITEYGFLAPPLRKSIEQALPPDQLFPKSPAWQFHANTFESGALDDRSQPGIFYQALDRFFGRRLDDLDLDTLLLLTQAWQAEAYRFSLSHFRRRKFLTSGATFWMYNDCWPATSSWTIIDYYLRRKPSYYAVKRAFAPEMLSFAADQEGLSAWLVNDHLSPVEGELEYGVGRFSDGKLDVLGRAAHHVPANCSHRLLALPPPCLSAKRKADTLEQCSFYWARWLRGGRVISSHYHWLTPWKDVALPDPGLTFKVTRKADHHLVEVAASRYAWLVVIEPAADLRPEDNYFDLLPGESRTLRVDGPADALARLSVRASNHLLSGEHCSF